MDDQPVGNQTYRVGVVFEVNKNAKNLQNHHVGVLLDGKPRGQGQNYVKDDVQTFEDVQLKDFSTTDETEGIKLSQSDYEELNDEELSNSPYYSQCFVDSNESLNKEINFDAPVGIRKLSVSTDEGEDIYLKPAVPPKQELFNLSDSGGIYDVTTSVEDLQKAFNKAESKKVELSKINFINEVEGHTDGINIIFKEDKLEPKTKLFRIGSNRNYRKKPRFPKLKKNKKADFQTIEEGLYKTFGEEISPFGSEVSLASSGQDCQDNVSESVGTTSRTESPLSREFSTEYIFSEGDDIVQTYSEGLIVNANSKIATYRVGLVVGDKMKIEDHPNIANEREEDDHQEFVKSVANDLGVSSNGLIDNIDSKIDSLPQYTNDYESPVFDYKLDFDGLNFDGLNYDKTDPATNNGYEKKIDVPEEIKEVQSYLNQEEEKKNFNLSLDTSDTIDLNGKLSSPSEADASSTDEGIEDSIELLTPSSLKYVPPEAGTLAEEVIFIEAKSRDKSIRRKSPSLPFTRGLKEKEPESVAVSSYIELDSKTVAPTVDCVIMEEKGEFDKFEWETNKPRGVLSPEASGSYSPGVKSPISPVDNRQKTDATNRKAEETPYVTEQRSPLEEFQMSRSIFVETQKVEIGCLASSAEEIIETVVTPEAANESHRPPSHPEAKIFEKLVQKEAIVGLPSEVVLEVIDSKVDVRLDEIHILPDDESIQLVDRTSIVSYSNRLRRLKLRFIPLDAGRCSLKVGSKNGSFADETISVEAEGNNPLLSFSEGDEYPLNVACSLIEPTVYVSYSHHISKFNHEGEFLRDIVCDKTVYFNDLAVDESSYIAVCTSSWDEEAKKKRSNQEVRLYDLFGVLLWKVGTPPSMNSEALCHVTFDWHGNVLFSTRRNLSRCSRLVGDLDISHPISGLEMVNRIAVSPRGEIVVLDGVSRKLLILDKTLNYLRSINLEPTNGPVENSTDTNECGYSGLCIDKFGNIVVSDCRRETVDIYRPDGTRLGWLESEWDPVRWPLSVSVTRSGFLFVVDHLNRCVKKFRYLT